MTDERTHVHLDALVARMNRQVAEINEGFRAACEDNAPRPKRLSAKLQADIVQAANDIAPHVAAIRKRIMKF